MPLRVRVCAAGEVPPGATRGFAVAGVTWPILVANIDGRLYAATSQCPHEEVSLLGGRRDGTRLTCPGHGYQFDLVTGRCAHDPQLALRCYPVTILDGEVFVDLI
jgi:3-phenylpropionate/trans-cinnamate dioxygenase ferredoxin subunit